VSTKYIMTRTNAHFNGINNPSNQSISFLSNSSSSCCSWLYTHPGSFCQDPGRNIYRRLLPFFTALISGVSRRARCVLRLEQKTAENGYFIIGEFGSLTLCLPWARSAQPGNLSPGYPQVINNRGVWEFEPKLPLWFNSLEACQIYFVMRKDYPPQPLRVPFPHVLHCVS